MNAAPVRVRGLVRHGAARSGLVGSRRLGRERSDVAMAATNSSATREPAEDAVVADQLNPLLRRVWGMKTKDANARPHSDGRDLLPFVLKSIGPPEKELGTFELDPLTHCGDSLFIGETRYVVKSTTMCYKLESGKYRMVGKQAALKEKARISAEEALERMFQAAEFTPPRPEREG